MPCAHWHHVLEDVPSDVLRARRRGQPAGVRVELGGVVLRKEVGEHHAAGRGRLPWVRGHVRDPVEDVVKRRAALLRLIEHDRQDHSFDARVRVAGAIGRMDLGDALHHEMHLARARVAAYVVLAPPLIVHTPVKLHFFQIVLVSCRGVVVVRMVIVRVIVRQPAVVVAVEPPQELRPLAKCGSRGAVDPVLVAHDHSEALPSVGKFETCSVGRKRLRQHEVGVRRLDKRGGVEVDWRTARVSVTVQRVDVDIYRNLEVVGGWRVTVRRAGRKQEGGSCGGRARAHRGEQGGRKGYLYYFSSSGIFRWRL